MLVNKQDRKMAETQSKAKASPQYGTSVDMSKTVMEHLEQVLMEILSQYSVYIPDPSPLHNIYIHSILLYIILDIHSILGLYYHTHSTSVPEHNITYIYNSHSLNVS